MLKKLLYFCIVGIMAFVFVHGIATQTLWLNGLERGFRDALFYLREPFIHHATPLTSGRWSRFFEENDSMKNANPFVSNRVRLLGYD